MNKGMTDLIVPIKLYSCVTPCETFSFIYFGVRTYRTQRTTTVHCCAARGYMILKITHR